MLLVGHLIAQSNQVMSPDVYEEWSSIKDQLTTPSGSHVIYSTFKEDNDGALHIYNVKAQSTQTYLRGKKPQLTYDGSYLGFLISPPLDSLKAMRRRKVKKDKLPLDTLVVVNLNSGEELIRTGETKKFTFPKFWNEYFVYQKRNNKKISDEENKFKTQGDSVCVFTFNTAESKWLTAIEDYALSEKKPGLILHQHPLDSQKISTIYAYSEQVFNPIWAQRGKYRHLAMAKDGSTAAFLADLDTTDAQIRSWEILYWKSGKTSAQTLPSSQQKIFPKHWIISKDQKPYFSDSNEYLFFGAKPQSKPVDTTLLEEEIAKVEVWTSNDERLYTQQKVRLEEDQKKSFLYLFDLAEEKVRSIGAQTIPQIRQSESKDHDLVLGLNEEPYYQYVSWEGFPSRKDAFTINLKTNEKVQWGEQIRGNIELSPMGKYAYWYSTPDSTWFVHHMEKGVTKELASKNLTPFYDELNDRPMYPYSYGSMGWAQEDEFILVYDRYDIWKIDPTGQRAPTNLTNGRSLQITYRYVDLDPEHQAVESKALLHVFDHQTKSTGYAYLDVKNGTVKSLGALEPLAFSTRAKKARKSGDLLFTKENFQTFPNLLLSDYNLKNPTQISDVNPQQQNYGWGSIELFSWTSAQGESLQGLLVKPPDFDPNKKYPLIVNFYERSSDRLHRHRAPYPHRSTINYSYYANRGYVIFNPDVPYKVGYPGESCYDAVISGVNALTSQGYIDTDRMGLQGHSWGGYQVAYLLTRTNMFACAESGAPVVNMTSAYGGIRWGSGLSRMFQYEHTQSRIGGTLWEKPMLYYNNSPLFFLEKTETPVLILHNDKDGAVPWYQGIEYFVALRRLGKEAYFLNYNDEPHWPVKRQNRLDFNRRMQEFFDHYLMDKRKPRWMKDGVPAINREVDLGFD